ncbi:MAG TPA: PilZ domain-containing protein [Planctomycetota bacterium]|nr:PilZ domain-containing protein [Planctomycetota bacterium]
MAKSEPNAKLRPLQGRERRAHPRAAADWPLEIMLTSGPRPGLVQARVRDVSRAGVSFYVDRPIAMMTMLELSLELPSAKGRQKLRGKGAVVRCEKISAAVEHYEVAVFLHELSETDRRAIDLHVGHGLAAGTLESADD